MSQCPILLLEDDPDQRALLCDILAEAGHPVEGVATAAEAETALQSGRWQLLLSDWKLAEGDAAELIQSARQRYPTLGIIVATAYGSIAHAVNAIQLGADDYLAKPFQRQELMLAIDKVSRARRLREDNAALSAQLSEQERLVDLVGHSAPMQRVYQRIQRISQASATVLIQGESGTGKELAARALHKLSPRGGPFIAVNCGAIPESLAESELFGAEKGAYTGAHQTIIGKIEAASGGTLFLDEIGELPLELQTRLLRVLQEGTITRLGSTQERNVDLRVIAATHQDLAQAVTQGRFREDLYYRLNVIPLQMPPLRARPEDIPSLARCLMERSAKRHGIEVQPLSQAALKTLMDYPWPGNVRELANAMERLVLLDELELNPLTPGKEQTPLLPSEGIQWEVLEQRYLKAALDRAEGNRSEAARLLGLGYKAFLYRAEKHGLS
ncbi:sigma-54-dependent transcriptional regulator [Ferrimonas balearica]|uniref:sigma-54-dependent transcriptional regulator n=1 Tax=Ferrimonas balearica TaxID=44012 RepID=UPI001C99AD0D|nr:sigma-54 dependent transcriptional regulator [Ferrimonas balearica]MBY5922055.1 sigma-54 dependent transcriptional regulator [Ferrimonas balearica]MBY5994605.1 sigma-54 dependent transcriptional regulator [Ferrimonas balearica]